MSIRKTVSLALVTVMAVMPLAGCISSQTGGVYSRDDARQAQTVRTGTIQALRPVKIEGTKSHIGTGVGAAAGGIGGSAIGHGKGSYVTAILGALAGGAAGSALEEGVTRSDGVEITVQEDDGSTRAYVQQVDKYDIFKVGERVRILTVNGQSRVTH